MANANPFTRQDRELERALERLERLYDQEGEPQRRYARDLEDIARLRGSNKIDKDHARYLRDAALTKLNEYRSKQRVKRNREVEREVQATIAPFVFFALLLFAVVLIVVVAFS